MDTQSQAPKLHKEPWTPQPKISQLYTHNPNMTTAANKHHSSTQTAPNTTVIQPFSLQPGLLLTSCSSPLGTSPPLHPQHLVPPQEAYVHVYASGQGCPSWYHLKMVTAGPLLYQSCVLQSYAMKADFSWFLLSLILDFSQIWAHQGL